MAHATRGQERVQGQGSAARAPAARRERQCRPARLAARGIEGVRRRRAAVADDQDPARPRGDIRSRGAARADAGSAARSTRERVDRRVAGRCRAQHCACACAGRAAVPPPSTAAAATPSATPVPIAPAIAPPTAAAAPAEAPHAFGPPPPQPTAQPGMSVPHDIAAARIGLAAPVERAADGGQRASGAIPGTTTRPVEKAQP